MIQVGTNLRNIDNSGARFVSCIGVLAGYKQRYAAFGEIITVAVEKLRTRRRAYSKVKKGQVLKALVVRLKKSIAYGATNLFFFENSVILLNRQYKLLGTRIFGALSKQLRYTKHMRIAFLSVGTVD